MWTWILFLWIYRFSLFVLVLFCALCFLVYVCGVCLVFVGICRYIERISCFAWYFFWIILLFDMLWKPFVFCWKKKANLNMSEVSTCQVFSELCLLHMKGLDMLLQKGFVMHAFVCQCTKPLLWALEFQQFSLDSGVVLTFQVMYIQVEVYYGISPTSRNELEDSYRSNV